MGNLTSEEAAICEKAPSAPWHATEAWAGKADSVVSIDARISLESALSSVRSWRWRVREMSKRVV